jgi:hypothetical protein
MNIIDKVVKCKMDLTPDGLGDVAWGKQFGGAIHIVRSCIELKW